MFLPTVDPIDPNDYAPIAQGLSGYRIHAGTVEKIWGMSGTRCAPLDRCQL